MGSLSGVSRGSSLTDDSDSDDDDNSNDDDDNETISRGSG